MHPVAPASHETLGADWIVVALLGSESLPEVKLVEVAVTSQPAPDPLASPTSNASVALTDCAVPFSVVAGNVTVAAGVLLMNDAPPAFRATDAVVASAGPGRAALSVAAKAAARASAGARPPLHRRYRAVLEKRPTAYASDVLWGALRTLPQNSTN